ncbi:hypothetical protein [Nocardia sp. NPDC020380]|uniref:hypothetical protein n=1 Tax=Nocardia sp. NPDC020380 TaxID=3364309 RepID=UPI0037905AEC
MTGSEDDVAKLITTLAQIVEGTFGIRLVPDEITARFGEEYPRLLHKLRLAAALAGIADRLMFDALQESLAAGIAADGVLEAAERQTDAGFHPHGRSEGRLHPLLFRLFRMQRAFSVDPTVPPSADSRISDPVDTHDPVMFAGGLAAVVGSSLVRFGMACARSNEMEEAQEAGATLTALAELQRVVANTVAPREIRWTGSRSETHDDVVRSPEPGHAGEADSLIDEGDAVDGPMTVGRLRQFLNDIAVPDHLPVVVGGLDFDDPSRHFNGLADAIWADNEGQFGGRLCIAAQGIGLVSG